MKYVALFLIFLAAPALAQDDPAVAARAAAKALEQASEQLDDADSARDRVKALTTTVRAYEDGLSAMREGLRRVSLREMDLRADLAEREAEISDLLGALMTIGNSEAPVLALHPSGPTGTARAGMLLADVTPALATRATALKEDLKEVSDLRQLQQEAEQRLTEGLQGVQLARTELSQAIDSRTDLPRRFIEDPVRTAILIAGTDTLNDFAAGLGEITQDEEPGSLPAISDRKGYLELPVPGKILRGAGEEDAAGVERPGIVVGTRPRALVTTPTAATIRYVGPLLDYGLVTILEPQADLLFVLAGLDQVYGRIGQVLPAGSPVGLMGGEMPAADEGLSQSGEGGGAQWTETLYMEVREGDDPVDPLTWFSTDKG
ncbi:murein hydrolase activator EnvC family protein [Primorskyibacter flagellatus]|uniref:Septal ring factor EnvC, activator of murein hydrolases AmiA and AmiB n=1 Tax=Primorskyibacter flagellatus TaxID=1387277 RepID=A0A1W2A0B9_9RHOB|nr:peptidase M23 [Primorskyibacter flagellatus]SMC53851.1 Septal ring factor EnvC, activator of murein hydrolases AmiA and AmiB [Primorskyibacter flagellatus]